MGPKPWTEVGETSIGCLEIYALRTGEPSDDVTTVRDSLRFVLEHAQNPPKWIYPGYRAGLAGCDTWIKALVADTFPFFTVKPAYIEYSDRRKTAIEALGHARAAEAKGLATLEELSGKLPT